MAFNSMPLLFAFFLLIASTNGDSNTAPGAFPHGKISSPPPPVNGSSPTPSVHTPPTTPYSPTPVTPLLHRHQVLSPMRGEMQIAFKEERMPKSMHYLLFKMQMRSTRPVWQQREMWQMLC
ncbi:hypothetical protein RND71_014446 [Anisodus tanguticus]|uniref:Transmembrane protein n=1 Tax=Anisodus tanguticus TaxID=243964 RepID=A0AAE1VJX5_9SOLA|nr:hypothetical protein RND71_014446 [Anisodus tanguticus]